MLRTHANASPLAAGVAGLALIAGPALAAPASAASGDAVVESGTVVVSDASAVPGTLTLTMPQDATAALVGQRSLADARVVADAALPTVTVVDSRADSALGTWQVSVQVSDFAGDAGSVSAYYLGWTPALPQMQLEDGSSLATQAGPPVASVSVDPSSAGLAVSALLARATAAGRGTTSLDAALHLVAPASTTPGTYRAVATVTLMAD